MIPNYLISSLLILLKEQVTIYENYNIFGFPYVEKITVTNKKTKALM